MTDYLRDDTEICYDNDGYTISYTSRAGLQGTGVVIPADKLSLHKISFISDKRGAIASLLESISEGKELGFYFNETFKDFKDAAEQIKSIDIPFLKIRYHEEKQKNGMRRFVISGLDNSYDVKFKDASSGMQTMTPLTLIAEYFSKSYDIVKETNWSIVNILGKNDSLASFKHDMNIGDIKQRYIHMFIEEPELSLFPKAQRSSVNMLVRKCINATTRMTLSVATHSPYIINHINLLFKAYDKGVLVEGASLNYDDTDVYKVEDGRVCSLKVNNAHLVNTDLLSDDINAIYDEYDVLDGIK